MSDLSGDTGSAPKEQGPSVPPEPFLPVAPGPEELVHHGSRARARWRTLGVFVAGGVFFVTATVGLAFLIDPDEEQDSPVVTEQSETPSEAVESVLAETEQDDLTPGRLLPLVETADVGPYLFILDETSQKPLLFDPCRPIFWVVNPENEPALGRELLISAFETIQEHTGLLFVFAGETNEEWFEERDPRNDTYTDVDSEWKPVIIWYLEEEDFYDAAEVWDIDGSEALAFAGSYSVYVTGLEDREVAISGDITMDATWADYILELGYPEELWWTLVHEIGHIVGLDHIEEPTHLMDGESEYQEAFGAGDIQGLALAGAATCLSTQDYPQKADFVPYW